MSYSQREYPTRKWPSWADKFFEDKHKCNCKCPQGAQGPAGPQGAQGPAGPPKSSTIIPYASGSTVSISSNFGDVVPATSALIGFGSSADSIPIGQNLDIDLSAYTLAPINYAFVMPRDGTLTSLAATFKISNAAVVLPADEEVTLAAQVYKSVHDAQFEPLQGAFVILSRLSGVIDANTTVTSIQELPPNLDVVAGTQLLLAFVLITEDAAPSASLSLVGYASAGLNIA